MNNRRWLRRIVRRLVIVLFGYHNFVNLYHKDHTAKQFEAYAKNRGLTVIPLSGVCAEIILPNTALDRMIYPLPDSEKKRAEEHQKSLSLWNKIKLYCKTGHHAGTADNNESVPPVIYLKSGEWITHIAVRKTPNYVFGRKVRLIMSGMNELYFRLSVLSIKV